MNKANHKAVGRYCYGGKIYTGQCRCGQEQFLDVEQFEKIVGSSYLKAKIEGRFHLARFINLF